MGTEYLGAISGTYGLLVDHFHYTVDRLGGINIYTTTQYYVYIIILCRRILLG